MHALYRRCRVFVIVKRAQDAIIFGVQTKQ